jgi:UPF0755 protein
MSGFGRDGAGTPTRWETTGRTTYQDADRRGDREPWRREAGYGGRPRRPRRGLLVVVLVGAVVLGIGGGVWAWVLGQIHQSAGGADVTVVVPPGEGLSALAPTLAKDGVISSTLVFKGYLHTKGHLPTVVAGTYVLHRHEPYSALLAALAKGPPTERLVIPEGFNLAQIAARVGQLPGQSAANFLAVARSGVVTSPYEPPGTTNLEGLLFPATYSFAIGTPDATILRMMVSAFDKEAASVGLQQGAAKLKITPYQAVIVASLVIQEAKPPDMAKVAEVIYNRMQAGMPLQFDSTVLYAVGGNRAALAGGNLQNVDPTSPYNTYVVKGLPPTPIASPGLLALTAALHPAAGKLAYFVTFPGGRDVFSATYAGQLANQAEAQRLAQAG